MGKTTIAATASTEAFTIYYKDIRAINWFLNTPVTDDTDQPSEIRTKEIPGHQRRKGPSDLNPVNVTQSSAEYLFDPTLKSGNALPGYSFILQTSPLADVDATRRFTLKGRSLDLITWLKTESKYELWVYLSEGGRHTIPAVISGGDGA